MSTVPATPDGNSDAELIAAVRDGDLAAYGTLYERHVSAAYNLARQLARSSSEADDLVSEAFAKVLDTLRAGKGPDSAFRAYLLTALRHTAYDKTRKDKRVDLNEDMSEATGALGGALTVPFSDTAVAGLERSMAAKAFAKLPERWQAVLWHTEIEQQSPAEVAPILGLTPNSVSALAYRAREGLRQAYLQVHLAETTEKRCRATADRLGAWTRDGLSKRERAQVEAHLDECERCRALAAELADVNGALRAVIAPLVLGGAALAYLATAGAGKAAAATAGAAAAGAAATTGAAASSSGGAGGAAGAAAGAPRQFLGVAASGVAIAAAVAVGLTAGGGQQVPQAIQPQADAPTTSEPAPESPKPAPESPAEDPAIPPAPPPVQPQTVPERAPAPPALPAPPELVVTTPDDGIQLEPGGGPVDLPITVRNEGETKSDPVVVTLDLPQGVRAIPPPGGGGGAPMSAQTAQRRDTAAPRSGRTVRCPGGKGKVSCSSGRGLEPGESVTLLFRLIADKRADPGKIRGTVSSGNAQPLVITVPYEVPPPPPPPPPADGVELDVHNVGRVLKIGVTNTGETTKRAVVVIDQPMLAHGGHGKASCTDDAESTTCRTNEPLAPGDDVHFHTVMSGFPENEKIVVTARIGKGSDTEEVSVRCIGGKVCAPDDTKPPLPAEQSENGPPSTTPSGPPNTTPPSNGPGRSGDAPGHESRSGKDSGPRGLRSLLVSLLNYP
ncbi:sigma-70 family RNA polymerase sigma factor [Haloechinothrix halophila]|uniref:sigma-70 family RNA polymerase sigma factor n=1 Tax=Haloechinothrix halophila TaxID=1069073 RepID=UPI000424B1DD|nr:sigma-70 family RNA polymerase sigma factor [Haloechinothrix halophila]